MNTITSIRQRWVGATAIAAGLIALIIVILRAQPIGAAVQDREPQNLAYLFFAPESASEAADLIESLLPVDGKIRFFAHQSGQPSLVLQPVILVSDYTKLMPLLDSPPLIRLLRALEKLAALSGALNIRLWHPEGVVLAKKLGIKRLPAVAVNHDGHWHVASGSRLDWNALLNCIGGK